MDDNEFAANMELGMVYLQVMGRVVEEGFGFISPELERWQDFGQSLLGTNIELASTSESANAVSVQEQQNNIGVGIIWEIDPETGNKKEFAVELDGSFFDSFSLQERVSYLLYYFYFYCLLFVSHLPSPVSLCLCVIRIACLFSVHLT